MMRGNVPPCTAKQKQHLKLTLRPTRKNFLAGFGFKLKITKISDEQELVRP